MTDPVAYYLADHLMADLRRGEQLPANLIESLHYPLYDLLRLRAVTKDWPLIQDMCYSRSEPMQRLGLNLSRNLQKSLPEVRQFLENMWYRNVLAPNVRNQIALQFSLLDYSDQPDFPNDLRDRLYRFTLDNWGPWLTAVGDWCGGPYEILKACEERIALVKSGGFPTNKRWAYICCAAAAADPDEATAFVGGFTDDGDAFTRSVATDVIQLINHKRYSQPNY
jgi:hypothetical protein